MTGQEAFFFFLSYANGPGSYRYMSNKLCTYCHHYTSINTLLYPGVLCMPLYVQPTFTLHTIAASPGRLLQCNAWWISRCPICAVMIKSGGLKVKSAGFLFFFKAEIWSPQPFVRLCALQSCRATPAVEGQVCELQSSHSVLKNVFST